MEENKFKIFNIFEIDKEKFIIFFYFLDIVIKRNLFLNDERIGKLFFIKFYNLN